MGRPPSQPFASDLRGAWMALFMLILDRRDRHRLRGFLGFLCRRGIRPEEATDAHLSAYLDELKRLRVKRTTQIGREAAVAWNRMASLCSDWPPNRLVVVDSLGARSLPFGAAPPSFEVDARTYLDVAPSEEDLFDESSHDGFAPATRVDRTHKIRQLLTIAIACGVLPCSLRTLRDLIEEKTLTRILEHLWEINGRKRNGHAANLARVLISIAKYHGAGTSIIEKLRKAHKKMRPQNSGMTDRNRAKLRSLLEDRNYQRLLLWPQAVLASLDNKEPSLADAVRLQSAVAVAIVMRAPMREKNLASLCDRHLDRDRYIVIPSHEVKNDRTLEYELPALVTTILAAYRQRYLPLLSNGRGNGALFISRHGREKSPSQLGTQITKFISDELGLTMNVHLFRHLAGYIFLQEHPGEYEPVRHLLGHKSIKTTIAFYTGLEESNTFRRWDQILDRRGRGEVIRATP